MLNEQFLLIGCRLGCHHNLRGCRLSRDRGSTLSSRMLLKEEGEFPSTTFHPRPSRGGRCRSNRGMSLVNVHSHDRVFVCLFDISVICRHKVCFGIRHISDFRDDFTLGFLLKGSFCALDREGSPSALADPSYPCAASRGSRLLEDSPSTAAGSG